MHAAARVAMRVASAIPALLVIVCVEGIADFDLLSGTNPSVSADHLDEDLPWDVPSSLCERTL